MAASGFAEMGVTGLAGLVALLALVGCSDRRVLSDERFPSPDGAHVLVVTRVLHGANDPDPFAIEVSLDGDEVLKIWGEGEVGVAWRSEQRVVVSLDSWLYRKNDPISQKVMDGVKVVFVEE